MEPPLKGNTTQKAEKLKSRKQIQHLFTGGKSFFIHPFKVLWQFNEADGHSGKKEFGKPGDRQGGKTNVSIVQIGFTVSKRNFKKAVDRNRVKRLMREVYRLNKEQLSLSAVNRQYSLAVFFIYIDKTIPTFDTLEEKMKGCLNKLQKIVEDH